MGLRFVLGMGLAILAVSSTSCSSTSHQAKNTSSTTTSSTSTTEAAPSAMGYQSAKTEWQEGSAVDTADQNSYWSTAVSDLTAGESHDTGNTGGYAAATAQLRYLISVPKMNATGAQNAEVNDDTLALNAFFDTNGLYGLSEPSYSAAEFAATIQREARIGTLEVDPQPSVPHASQTPGWPLPIADASATCPAFSSLSTGSAFACRILSQSEGTFWIVGKLQAANAMMFLGEMSRGTPSFAEFQCKAIFDAAELAVLKQIGGSCTNSS
jgi:hypothetical protein